MWKNQEINISVDTVTQQTDIIQISLIVLTVFWSKNFSSSGFKSRTPVAFQLSFPFSHPSSESVLVCLFNFDTFKSL